MIKYKHGRSFAKDRVDESKKKCVSSPEEDTTIKDRYREFIESEDEVTLTTSLAYFYLILKENLLILKDDFIDKLMTYLLKKRFSSDNITISLKLISKILNFNTGMIDSLLEYGLINLIERYYPNIYSLKFCTKLSKYRPALKQKFLEDGCFFYKIEDFEMCEADFKLYAKFFSSLVKNVYEDLPSRYFDFCNFLVKNLVDLVNEDSVRYSIITAFLTLIQASSSYVDEMIERNTFILLKDAIRSKEESEELEDISNNEILYMEDITKREVINILQILIVLVNDESKNYSQYLIENGFIEWIYSFYQQNKEFQNIQRNDDGDLINEKQFDRKKVMNSYLEFLGDLALYDKSIFQHPLYIQQIYDILEHFDIYHYQTKTSIIRLLCILFDCAPDEIFPQLLDNQFHLIFLQYISYTDSSDRMKVLSACLKIFRNCPSDMISDLCDSAKNDEDFIDFLEKDEPDDDNSQRFANLILGTIHQFDDDDNNDDL